MYEKLRGIVLNTIRYSDKHNIVHIYTDGRGLMSFAVPIGKTPASRMRNALLMPLSLVNLEAAIRNGRDLAVMRELQRNYPLASIYSDPVKNAISLFISELLAHVIQEPEGNEPLFRYIEQSVQLLEQLPGQVSRMSFANMGVFRFNREERNRMLDVIISYYRLHNAAIGTLRSPDILKQLFV